MWPYVPTTQKNISCITDYKELSFDFFPNKFKQVFNMFNIDS